MTRRLALMLAIAILLMVNTLAGEGGPLDTFNGAGGGEEAVLADAGEEAAPPPAELAVATALPQPAPRSTEGSWTDEIGMYGEDEEEEDLFAPAPSAPPAPRAESNWGNAPPARAERVHTPRIGNRGDVGALDAHRLGVEI